MQFPLSTRRIGRLTSGKVFLPVQLPHALSTIDPVLARYLWRSGAGKELIIELFMSNPASNPDLVLLSVLHSEFCHQEAVIKAAAC